MIGIQIILAINHISNEIENNIGTHETPTFASHIKT